MIWSSADELLGVTWPTSLTRVILHDACSAAAQVRRQTAQQKTVAAARRLHRLLASRMQRAAAAARVTQRTPQPLLHRVAQAGAGVEAGAEAKGRTTGAAARRAVPAVGGAIAEQRL